MVVSHPEGLFSKLYFAFGDAHESTCIQPAIFYPTASK